MSTAVQPAPVFTPTDSQIAMAYSVCRGITRKAAKNFYYAFLILPRSKRQALCAVYAFMRRCDDIADDESLPLRERRQKLSEWLDLTHRAFAGYPTDEPVLLALAHAQCRFAIPVGLLDELAHGTAMDIEEQPLIENGQNSKLQIRFPAFADLRQYCHRVASVVGLVCIRIFGYKDPAAEPLAERCGLAFQLTNIIRDIKEDAAAKRIYIPEEDLAKFGISPEELLTATDAPRYAPLLTMEADRAREYYNAGEQLIPLVEEDSQPALWVLIHIYRALLEKIATRQYDVFHGKISLSMREKLVILFRGVLRRIV